MSFWNRRSKIRFVLFAVAFPGLVLAQNAFLLSHGGDNLFGSGVSNADGVEGISQNKSTNARFFTLEGDPAFRRADLSPETRMWYDRFWAAIERDRTGNSPDVNATAIAASDDTYHYGRAMAQYIGALLLAFRATGDLEILDEVDRLTQIMRSKLYDGWISHDNYKDGYLNWRYRRGGRTWEGTDSREGDEANTHALVAQFAYAFNVNRGLASPGGVNYTERADFWKDYLLDHFEAKWRACVSLPNGRNRKCNARDVDFFYSGSGGHTRLAWSKYNWYRGRLTKSLPHQDFALNGQDGAQDWMNTARVNGVANGGYQEIPTPLGTAVVWSRGQPAVDHRTGRHLHPGNYFRYHVNHAIDFHVEGLFPQSVMQKMGAAIAYFFMDTEDISISTTFGLSIGGNEPLAHDSWSYQIDDRGRTTLQRFLTSSYATPLAFMTDGPAKKRLKSISVAAYQARYSDQHAPRNPTIPAIMLAAEVWNHEP